MTREDDRQGQERRGPRPSPRLRGAQAPPARAPAGRPHRRHRRALQRAASQRRRTPTSPRSRSSSTARRCAATRPASATRRRSTRSSTRSSARRSTTSRSRAFAPARARRSSSSGGSPTAPRSPARERRIVKTKRFAIEPMFEEDAIAGWRSSATGSSSSSTPRPSRSRSCTRRDDGDYGVIEPVDRRRLHEGRSSGDGGRRRAEVTRRPRDARADRVDRASYDAADASRRSTARRPPAARRRDGQGRRARPRDRRRGAPGLRRQPDGLAPTRRAAARAGRPSAIGCVEHDIAPVAIHALVPGQPGRARRDVLRPLGRVLAHELRAAPGFRRPVRQRPHRLAPRHRRRGRHRAAGRGRRPRPSAEVDDGPRRDDARARELGRQRLRPRHDVDGAGRRSPRRSQRAGSRPSGSGSASTRRMPGAPGSTSPTPTAIDAFLADFDARIGLDRLVMVHLNDSKSERGSRPIATSTSAPAGSAPAGWRTCSATRRWRTPPYFLETPGWTRATTRSTWRGPATWSPGGRWRAATGRLRRARQPQRPGRRRRDGRRAVAVAPTRRSIARRRPARAAGARRGPAPPGPRDARHLGRRPGPRHARAPRACPRRRRPAARPADLDRRRPPRRALLLPARPGGGPDRRRLAARRRRRSSRWRGSRRSA